MSNYCAEYEQSKDMDELFVYSGEALAIASSSLLVKLIPKRKSGLRLRFEKKFSPKKYLIFWEQHIQIFTSCLLLLMIDLQEFLNKREGISLNIHEFNTLATFSLVALQRILNMDKEEKSLTLELFKPLLIDFEFNPPADRDDQLKKIIASRIEHLQKHQIAEFIKDFHMKNPLYIIQPLCFTNSFIKFKSNA